MVAERERVIEMLSKRKGELNGKIQLPSCEKLESLYWQDGCKKTAQALGVSERTLLRRLHEYGVSVKEPIKKIYIDYQELKSLYATYGVKVIGRILNVSTPVLLRRLREYNISVRNVGSPKELPEYWKNALRKPKSKVLKREESPFWKAEIHTGEKIRCNCGCGQLIDKYDKRGRRRYYAPSHCPSGHFKSEDVRGENACNWKGGTTPAMDALRKTPEYTQWRLLVYERDHYTCQMCGHKHTDIVAHHIKSFAENEELRFELSNGVVLCRSCHLKLHRQLATGINN